MFFHLYLLYCLYSHSNEFNMLKIENSQETMTQMLNTGKSNATTKFQPKFRVWSKNHSFDSLNMVLNNNSVRDARHKKCANVR